MHIKHGGQRTTFKNQLSPFTFTWMWGLNSGRQACALHLPGHLASPDFKFLKVRVLCSAMLFFLTKIKYEPELLKVF